MDIGFIGIAACEGFSALGSGIGCGIASMSVIGAWKKCFVQNKPAPFIMVAFAGLPLTQVIYGYILMNAFLGSNLEPLAKLSFGTFAGFVMFATAMLQAKCAALGADSYGETGKGFANTVMVIGVIETIALFLLVFFLGVANNA